MSRITTTKEFKEKFTKYFLEHACDDDFQAESKDDIIPCLEHFWNRFDVEFNFPYNKRRYPSLQTRLAEYLSGLAFSFDFTDYDITERLLWFGLLKGTEKGSEKNDKMVWNWFTNLAGNILQLCRWNKFDYSKYI